MGYYESLEKRFGKMHPLALAILIDILMVIPFIDFLITIPLQWILWSKLDNEMFKYVNITYDTVADFVVPIIGDLFPLNTISVILVLAKRKVMG